MIRLELPEVRLVDDGAGGQHVEPDLCEHADDAARIAWKTAVTAAETGLDITVLIDHRGWFAFTIRRHVGTSARPFSDAWTWLNGVTVGAQAVRRDNTAAILSRAARASAVLKFVEDEAAAGNTLAVVEPDGTVRKVDILP